MTDKFFAFLGIEQDEQAPLTFLTLRAAAVAIIIVATFVYQSAFFLNIFRAAMLPWLYATVAIITVIISFPYAYLHRKLGDKRADTVTMLFFGSGLLVPLFFPDLLLEKAPLFVLSIWVKLAGAFASISFWHHATRAFPSRRAKAILPVVAAGFSLGSALAGKVIHLVAVHYGSNLILPIILAAIAINIALPSRGAQPEKVIRARKKRGNLLKQGIVLLRSNRLALYLTLFILFSIPVFLCVDFILKKAVRANFGKDGMAAFFANYQLYLNLGVFLLQTAVMGRLMRRLGVTVITVITPLFLLLTFPILIVYPTLTFALIFAVFAGTLRLTVHTNSRNQLITPLSPAEKETTSMFLRTIIAPVGTILTSLALLPLKYSSIKIIAGFSLGMAAIFLFAAMQAARAYNRELLQALKKKTLSFEHIDRLPLAPDGSVLQNLRDRILSPSFEEASFAVSLLAEYNELNLQDLDSFFKKEFKGITGLLPRLKAIELGLYLKPRDKQIFFTTIFEESSHPEILMEAARITLVHKPDWLPPYASAMLTKRESLLDRGIALYILVELDQIPEGFPIQNTMEELAAGDENLQLLAAHIAASLGNDLGDAMLGRLMDLPSSAVTIRCITLTGTKQRSALYQRLLDEAPNHQYRKPAFDSILLSGLEVRAAEQYLLRGKAPQLTVHQIRALVLSRRPEAWATIERLIERGRGWHLAILLSELERIGAGVALGPQLHNLLSRAQENLLRLRFAESNSAHPLVRIQIAAEATFWTQLLFSCLRLTHPRHAGRLSDIEKSVSSKNPRQINAAIELLEDWCPANLSWLPMALEKKVADMEACIDAFPHIDPRANTLSLISAVGDTILQETIEVLLGTRECSPEERELVFRAMHLRNSGFFKNLATEILMEIAAMGERRELPGQTDLFREGDEGDGLYFVMEGELDVIIKETTVNNLRQGAVLGEIALLDQGLRTATIRAATDAVLIRISPKMFDEMIQEYPLVAKQVAATLVGHIRRLVPHVETAAVRS